MFNYPGVIVVHLEGLYGDVDILATLPPTPQLEKMTMKPGYLLTVLAKMWEEMT